MSTRELKEIVLPDAEATRMLGAAIGSLTSQGPCLCIALTGTLGAGKTTFAQGLARSLGIDEIVNSPTFTMMNEYANASVPLFHFDLYRMAENVSAGSSGAEHFEQELEELMQHKGVFLFEWANYFQSFFERHDCLFVHLKYSSSDSADAADDFAVCEDGRLAVISSSGPTSSRIVDSLANVYFS